MLAIVIVFGFEIILCKRDRKCKGLEGGETHGKFKEFKGTWISISMVRYWAGETKVGHRLRGATDGFLVSSTFPPKLVSHYDSPRLLPKWNIT